MSNRPNIQHPLQTPLRRFSSPEEDARTRAGDVDADLVPDRRFQPANAAGEGLTDEGGVFETFSGEGGGATEGGEGEVALRDGAVAVSVRRSGSRVDGEEVMGKGREEEREKERMKWKDERATTATP